METACITDVQFTCLILLFWYAKNTISIELEVLTGKVLKSL